MDNLPIELDVHHILHYVRVVSDTLGAKWFARKIKEEKKRRNAYSQRSKNRKHTYLYQKKGHPLIEWAIEFDKWRKETLKSGKIELTESILKYSILGKSLEQSREQAGFNKLIKRLKMKEEFFSSAFEVEVAASYVSKGYKVEFIEEGGERSPDLKVIIEENNIFWVECKCRDILTERDKKINVIWTELESALLREFGPKKINAAIIVKSLRDPVRDDIDGLLSFILDCTNNAQVSNPGEAEEIRSISDHTNNYQIAVNILSNADEVIESQGISFNSSEKLDRMTMLAEMKIDKNNKSFVKNPIMIGFKNAIPSDKVSGIIHGFKSAVGQLPKEGPGVVWIRVADNSWNDNLDQSFAQAESLLKSELTGVQNQRINTVYLMTRIFQKLEKGNHKGLSYKPLILNVTHDNPRKPAQ